MKERRKESLSKGRERKKKKLEENNDRNKIS